MSAPIESQRAEGFAPSPVRCSCGSLSFVRVTPVRGTWREYVVFNDDGSENFEQSESTTDDLIHGKLPKTMKCGQCGKRKQNPDIPNAKLSDGMAKGDQ